MAVIYIQDDIPYNTPLKIKNIKKKVEPIVPPITEYLYFDKYKTITTELSGSYNLEEDLQVGYTYNLTQDGGKNNREINFISGDVGCQTTSVGAYAFSRCDRLINVSVPTIETLGDHAFSYCKNLMSVDFLSVTAIGNYVFEKDNALNSIDFPNVEIIGEGIFSECWGLKNVNLPKVKEIPAKAFNFCPLMETITLPSVEAFGEDCFKDCTSILSIDLSENDNWTVYKIKNELKLNKLVLVDGVTIKCKDGDLVVNKEEIEALSLSSRKSRKRKNSKNNV